MKTRTLYFAPGRAAPGMTLAQAIHDKDGHMLLAAGATLDGAMLERLIRRGIEVIAVLVVDNRSPETIAEEIRLAEARAAAIFRASGSNSRASLHAAVLDYRRESLQ